MPSGGPSTNYDEITTTSGSRCRQALGSNWNLEAGTLTLGSETGPDSFGGQDQVAVYLRMTYALGAKPRIDCSRIYELELEALKMEIELLRSGWME